MEIPYFKCQLLNGGRRDFSQWIENSLGSRLSWRKEGKKSNRRITVTLIDSSSLLVLYLYLFCDFPPSFIFYLIPVTPLLDPWTMAYSKNFKKKFFFNKMTNVATYNLLPEAIAPFQWVWARAEAVDGYVSASVCVCLGVWKGALQGCVLAVVCSAGAADHQKGVLQELAPCQAFRKLLMWNHGFCN